MNGTPPLPTHQVQFRLWHLFALTTIVSVAAAIAAYLGAGTLVLSIGLILGWLNVCGAFRGVQSGRRQTAILALASVVFLVSLALPSVEVFNAASGAWAAWFAFAMPIETILNRPEIRVTWSVFLAVDVANSLMILLPLLIWRLSRGYGQWLKTSLCVVMPAVWCLGCSPMGLMIGYYVWCASYALALVGLPIRRSVFAAMLIVAATLALIVLRWD